MWLQYLVSPLSQNEGRMEETSISVAWVARLLNYRYSELYALKTNVMFYEANDPNYAVAVQDISDLLPDINRDHPDGTVLLSKALLKDKFLKEGLRKSVPPFLGFNCNPPATFSYIAIV